MSNDGSHVVVRHCPLPKTRHARTARLWQRHWDDGPAGLLLGGLTYDVTGEIVVFMMAPGAAGDPALGTMPLADLVGNAAFLNLFAEGSEERDLLECAAADYLAGTLQPIRSTRGFADVGVF